ncbi:MAG: PilW family protein [Granulosicoccus sp.]
MSRQSWMLVSKRQQGISLIELMIGMVLGLIVIAAVFNMYTGSSRSQRYTAGLQSMQENGRYGISVLQNGFRLAGYSPDTSLAAFNLADSDDQTVIVQVRQPYDCNGADTSGTDGVAVNTYRLDVGNQQITCAGNQAGATNMPIVEGVERWRVLYGLDTDGDDVPERYVPYASVTAANEISALRFAFLVNSGAPIRTRARAETYVLLDQEVTLTDRIARTVYSSTVKLRNRR